MLYLEGTAGEVIPAVEKSAGMAVVIPAVVLEQAHLYNGHWLRNF